MDATNLIQSEQRITFKVYIAYKRLGRYAQLHWYLRGCSSTANGQPSDGYTAEALKLINTRSNGVAESSLDYPASYHRNAYETTRNASERRLHCPLMLTARLLYRLIHIHVVRSNDRSMPQLDDSLRC